MTTHAALDANTQFTPDANSALSSFKRVEVSPHAPVRIAYCVDTMQVGGTELNALRTIECIDRSRFDISVISLQPDGPLAERYRAAGVTVHPYRLKSLYAPDTLRQGLRLMRWLRRERIEILHCHDLYANLFAAPWGRMAGVRAVITSRRWLECPADRQLEIANRFVYRVGHWALANSPAVARTLVNMDRVSPNKVLTVSNFVGDAAFEPLPAMKKSHLRSEFGIPADAVVIGCVARLTPVKDHVTLFRAVHQLLRRWPRLHLCLVGHGELRDELEEIAAELDISDHVHFAGLQPNEPNLHHLFDISVLTSLSEGFPNALVEAMAASRPVVATSVGGNVDAVRPDTGFLVPPGAPTELASALERLLSDDSLRMRMGAAARLTAMREYHVTSVIPRLEQLYMNLARSVGSLS
jgi:glycosyltransferase involved in cell wall biosynthesis